MKKKKKEKAKKAASICGNNIVKLLSGEKQNISSRLIANQLSKKSKYGHVEVKRNNNVQKRTMKALSA